MADNIHTIIPSIIIAPEAPARVYTLRLDGREVVDVPSQGAS